MNRKLQEEFDLARKLMGMVKVMVTNKTEDEITPFGAELPQGIVRGDGEDADICVCQLADLDHMYFQDNVFTDCADCGERIQHRPHAPKKPVKLCIRCAFKRAETEDDNN